MIIRTQAFPRAGLVGNPSDGYFGKTIALAFSNYRAEVILYESPELEILPNTRDHSRFASLTALARDVGLYGYYGGSSAFTIIAGFVVMRCMTGISPSVTTRIFHIWWA